MNMAGGITATEESTGIIQAKPPAQIGHGIIKMAGFRMA